MKVLILSNANPFKTAGIAVRDIYEGLAKHENHQVCLLVRKKCPYKDKKIITAENSFTSLVRKAKDRSARLFKSNFNPKPERNTDYAFHNYDHTREFFNTEKLLRKAPFKPDAIVVIFMQHFLTFKNLFELARITGAKVFLYFMDMAPMTGGCHYAWDCNGYHNSCGKCPALFSDDVNDQSRINWLFKQKYGDKFDITPVVCTEWQLSQINQSGLFRNKKAFKIPLPVNPQLFYPANKRAARTVFNLPHDKKIVLIGAVEVNNKRKGFNELISALLIAKEDPDFDSNAVHLLVVGKSSTELENRLPFQFTSVGFLDHENLAAAFRAADFYLCTSIEDSGPMMINQAVMSGVPVISFNMGAAPDFVVPEHNGYIARLGDTQDLANGLKELVAANVQEYEKMSRNCRDLALKLCHPKVQAESLSQLFKT